MQDEEVLKTKVGGLVRREWEEEEQGGRMEKGQTGVKTSF